MKRGAGFRSGTGTSAYMGKMSSREGPIGQNTRGEEKEAVVRYMEAVGARGVYTGYIGGY